MYRRVNSGRFIVITTAGIVVIMAIFTWVMYGMAQQVFTMTDVMVQMGKDFSHLVVTQETMVFDMHDMGQNVGAMNATIGGMAQDIGQMNGAVQRMNVSIGQMTHDISKATYAFSQPMSYMWGNPFGF